MIFLLYTGTSALIIYFQHPETQKLQLCTTAYIGQDFQKQQTKFFSGARLGSMSCLRGGSPSETVHQAWRDARVYSAQVTDRPLLFFEIICTKNICNFLCHQSYLLLSVRKASSCWCSTCTTSCSTWRRTPVWSFLLLTTKTFRSKWWKIKVVSKLSQSCLKVALHEEHKSDLFSADHEDVP